MKTKCAVIREEFVALTGDFKRAIVLGQMIYWSERVKDRASFVEEEYQRYGDPEQDGSIIHGWFYKRAEDLSEETMMGVKPKAMREYIKHLVEHGWVFEQRNSIDKMDRTLHYRVNLVKIHQDLQQLGYTLKRCTSHPFPTGENETSSVHNESTNEKKKIATRDDDRAMRNNTPATCPKEPFNLPEKTSATSEKETTPSPKNLAPQGFQATNSMPEITKQRLQDSEITLTHQEPVVCARIRDLFGKKLSRTKIRSLIDLAEREDVDLGQVIENTYTYHTRIEKCRSIFGAISYAIENGGWEMCSSSHPQKQPLPKAVQEQRDGRNTSRIDPFDPEIIEAKKRIRESMEKMGYVYNEALGG